MAMNSPKKRVMVLRLFHETHAFLSLKTPLADFRIRLGQQLFACVGDGSTLDGFLEYAGQADWEVVPAVDFVAFPSGPVEAAVFESYWTLLVQVLTENSGGLDGLFVILHGAMATVSLDDVEGELLERIRHFPGYADLPIFGVYDLHATFTDRMAAYANCLVAYRENPHADARDRSIHAAELLDRSLTTGMVPRMTWRHADLIWPPGGTATALDPMATLERSARQLEKDTDAVWAANVNAGFAYSDSRDTGVSFSVSHIGADQYVSSALEGMVRQAVASRDQGYPLEHRLDDVLGALPVGRGPIVIVEAADNIGAGTQGDSLEVLKAFLAFDVPHAGVVVNAPRVVEALSQAEVGSTATISLPDPYPSGAGIGGWLVIDVEVLSRSDGAFVLDDVRSHLASMAGAKIEMGDCVVVRHRNIVLLLTSRPTPPFDLGQWTSQGIDPRAFRLVAVKAAVGHRRAYDPIAIANIEVATEGPCPSDVRKLTYTRLERPPYPLVA